MDFSISAEQLARKQDAIEFAQRELNPDDMVRHDLEGVFSHEVWKKCADYGLLGLAVEEKYGGSDEDLLTTMLIMEGIGYGCSDNGLPFALNSKMWSVQAALTTFGSEFQKQKYLCPLVKGDMLGAFGMTEPDTGSDAYALKATAVKVDGGYLLNGRKFLITLAPVCDMAIVFANVDHSLGRWGVSTFIVDRTMSGFTTSPVRQKMGLRTVPAGDLILEDCFVPDKNRMGDEGVGVSVFNHSMEWERAFILISQIGRMERQLDETIAYANRREQGGSPIAAYQSVANRIVDMKVRLEAARLMLYKVAWLTANGQPSVTEAAMAKLFLSEAFTESSLDAIRVHGGRGFLTEFEIERDLRDSVGGLIYSGTSDIQRNLIARQIGLNTAS